MCAAGGPTIVAVEKVLKWGEVILLVCRTPGTCGRFTSVEWSPFCPSPNSAPILVGMEGKTGKVHFFDVGLLVATRALHCA